MKTMKERMLTGDLYIPSLTEGLRDLSIKGKKLAQQYNRLDFDDFEGRRALLKQLFGKTGEKIYMEQPVYVDYGVHTTIGEGFYANFDCTLLDVAPITIGDNCMFGPHVSLVTPGHPTDAETRNAGPEFGKPITIGNNTVIGSGSVVTKDIPSNVIAVGNPCRVLREITEEEKADWRQKHQELLKELGK